MTSQAPFSSAHLWLEERYAYDARARNRNLEKLVAADLKAFRFLRIVDLGAGLGANLRYYSDFFDCDQEWYCVEKDLALCEAFFPHLERWAFEQGWSCRRDSQLIILQKKKKTVTASLLPGSFIPFPTALASIPLDLGLANAVFDLVSGQQFSFLAEALASRAVPLLATLNYVSMRFVPSRIEDQRIIKLYDQTMTFPGPAGTPMGPRCAAVMKKILKESDYQVADGKSPWTISGDDGSLLHLLLQYVQTSVSAFRGEKIEIDDLEDWIRRKKEGVISGAVKLLVRHHDLYARLPRGRASRL
ncbi:MAG: hypothetical protein AB1715_04970 [Acidobacteriota bacterium]